MAEIKSAGILLCFMMVLMTYLKQMIPVGKTTGIMKLIVSIFIAAAVINSFRALDMERLKSALTFSENQDVWEESAMKIGEGLKKEYQNFLAESEVNALVEEVSVKFDADKITVLNVVVSGRDASTAKNLLAGRYQIGIRYFEVKNE